VSITGAKTRIISEKQRIARRIEEDDLILIFFAGHGYTERIAGRDWGYIVPHDGGRESTSYISMEELRNQSQKMGNAKHQLSIMDCCYGGLLGVRGGGVDTSNPEYLAEVTRRPAR